MFKKVDARQSMPKLEEEVLKYWDEHKTFEKSVAKDAPKGSFIFYEGPPTANGKPGLHHVLARAFKDVVPRYKTMKGYRVERKAGWDTHGLPVELQVEKALGLKNKQEIENIVPGDKRASIIEFNKRCKESVWEYKDLWEKMTERMGYWVDMEHPYVTYDNRYIESVWWQLAQIAKVKDSKGESMLYRGRKIVPYCYRCGTALSSHEVAQGYQTVKDNSVYVKFKVVPGQKIGDFTTDDSTYFLAWTTTPWTLPGNVALAVGENFEYSIIKHDSRKFVIATDRLGVVEGDYRIVAKVLGRQLLDMSYAPLFETNDTSKRAYIVVSGDFVTTQDGTGIVHIAPAFGEDDLKVGEENDLPILVTVGLDGAIVKGFDLPGEGVPVKKKDSNNRSAVDRAIIERLVEKELFYKLEMYEHEYPFCWRCDTPLIYYAKPSWFIRMSELSDDLVKNNESINWIPEHIKEGRFGEWLKGVKDWAISRDRYWGTPLPIWECRGENGMQIGCGHAKAIESIKELEKLSGQTLDDVHKPYIDDVTFPCEKCGGVMERTPEVLDVWFDSGAMPLAQFHYPAGATEDEKRAIEGGKYFPADYISEAIDQTRGWFYTLHAVATLLHKAGKVPAGYAYKNVICLAHILDAQGKKMSKSRGNVLDPFDLMNEFGADSVRWMLFTINQPGLPKRFDIKGMRDVQNRVFRMLWNSYYFFVMYAEIDKWKLSKEPVKPENLLDRWILSELQVLIREVDARLDAYDIYAAGKAIEAFIDNLSNWYIRRSRKRFWKNENDGDKNAAYQTLHTVLVTLAKLMAPFTPFVAEEIYRNLMGFACHPELVSGSERGGDSSEMPKQVRHDNVAESVHLADFPTVDESLIDEKLNADMGMTRNLITEGLQLRAQEKIKVRQPLSRAYLLVDLGEEFRKIMEDELNVKEVLWDVETSRNMEGNMRMDFTITEELKLEGQAREIIRFVQELRKEAGYDVENRIAVGYQGAEEVFEKFGEMIAKEVLAEGGLRPGELEGADIQKEVTVDGMKISVWLKR
jgi:isoleucyl-tRNA synthetase